jgi:hypothetical protein
MRGIIFVMVSAALMLPEVCEAGIFRSNITEGHISRNIFDGFVFHRVTNVPHVIENISIHYFSIDQNECLPAFDLIKNLLGKWRRLRPVQLNLEIGITADRKVGGIVPVYCGFWHLFGVNDHTRFAYDKCGAFAEIRYTKFNYGRLPDSNVLKFKIGYSQLGSLGQLHALFGKLSGFSGGIGQLFVGVDESIGLSSGASHLLQLPLHDLQLATNLFIGVMDNDHVSDGRAKQKGSPSDKPSSETVNRDWLIEPPSSFFWRLLFFGAPGIALAVTGFVFLNGPHRRPGIGAALYFFGLLLFAGAALALV